MSERLNQVRRGAGSPLVLVHGLGASWRSWEPVLDALAAEREVVAFDLPGHGESPARPDSGTFVGLTDSVGRFLADEGLAGADLVGSSMGARIVLELACRGGTGAVVALDPGGFWKGWERGFFRATIAASVKMLRLLRPALPALTRNAVGRSLLLAQLSKYPAALDPEFVARELDVFAGTPTADALIRDLANGPQQTGPAAPDSGPVTIGWGRSDRLCLPRQARRAQRAFPDATLRWFEESGHFPLWDEPQATARLILERTARRG
jgi:pimeloyl-ACP methyl ester carboxylesterase